MEVRHFDRPAHPSCYVVAGRFVFVESANSQLAELLDRLFDGWLLTPVPFSNQQPQVRIICSCESPPVIPPNLEQFEIAEQAQCYIGDNICYLDLGNSLLQLTSSVVVQVEIWFKRQLESVNANLARTLSFAVCAGLRRHGMFELHGAGLPAPDDESGVVIIGPSGSGKSTLATQLVASGWGYLSDDELLLTLEQEEVIARGFRSFFALSPDAMVATGVANAIAKSPAVDSKACFEPGEFFGQRHIETTKPRWLFFTSIGGKVETQVSELSRKETMMRLLRACPWATYDKEIAAENLRVLSSLARQSKGFDLVAGRDLLKPGYADALLRTVIQRS